MHAKGNQMNQIEKKLELEIAALEAALPGLAKAEQMLRPLGEGGLATQMADLWWAFEQQRKKLARALREAAE